MSDLNVLQRCWSYATLTQARKCEDQVGCQIEILLEFSWNPQCILSRPVSVSFHTVDLGEQNAVHRCKLHNIWPPVAA